MGSGFLLLPLKSETWGLVVLRGANLYRSYRRFLEGYCGLGVPGFASQSEPSLYITPQQCESIFFYFKIFFALEKHEHLIYAYIQCIKDIFWKSSDKSSILVLLFVE